MDKAGLKRLIDVAAGREKADVVIKNAKIVNVFSGKIMEGNIAIVGEEFAGVGDYEGVEEMRELSNKSLEEAMAFGLSFSVADLANRRLAIDPNSLACYNEVVLKTSKNYNKSKQ